MLQHPSQYIYKPKKWVMHMTNLIKSWNDRSIRIRGDRYVSLTDMAQATGKNLGHWLENKATHSYLDAMSNRIGIPTMAQNQGFQALVETRKGGDVTKSGTWGHPKVAIRFAQWCSDEFAVQVDIWTDELMTTGKIELVPQIAIPKTRAEALRLAADLEDQLEAEKLLTQQLKQEKQTLQLAITEAKPKADFYDIYVSADGWITGELIAKQLSVSNRKMFDILRFEKIIYKRTQGGRNYPCQKWVDKGLATMRETRCSDNIMRFNLVFSHRSVIQIFDLLQDKGLIPKNRDFQLRFELDEPKPMKRA